MKLFLYRAIFPIFLLFSTCWGAPFLSCSAKASELFVPSINRSTTLTGLVAPAGATYSFDGRWFSFTQNNTILSSYSVGEDGAVSFSASYSTPQGTTPFSAAYNPAAPVLEEAGFASASGLSLFSYDQQSGLLLFPALSAQVNSGDNSIESRFSPFGNFVAVANVNALQGTNSSSISFLRTTSTGIQNSFILNTFHNFNSTTQNQLSFSPDERFLAAANYDNGGANGSISVFRITNLLMPLSYFQQVSIPNSNGITSVAYSPRGDLLAATNNGSSLYFFSVNKVTGTLTFLTETTGLTGGLQSLAFSPDGNFLVVASNASSSALVFVRTTANTFSQGSEALALAGNPTQLVFSPLLSNGTASFAALSSSGTITTYTFSLMPPFGKLAQTIRTKYLYKQ